MATKYFEFSGKTKWAKVRKPDEKYNNFQVPLYLDDKNLAKFKEIGLELKVKTDDDGTYVTFKRPMEKLIKGEIVKFGPPAVYDKDNQPLENVLIGNGSELTVRISVYDTIKGKGHRLEAVRVEKLVEYQGSTMPIPGAAPSGVSAARPALPF